VSGPKLFPAYSPGALELGGIEGRAAFCRGNTRKTVPWARWQTMGGAGSCAAGVNPRLQPFKLYRAFPVVAPFPQQGTMLNPWGAGARGRGMGA